MNILIYIPIFVKYHIVSSMTNDLMLMLSGLLLFGYSFLKIFIEFLIFKYKNWHSKLDAYNKLTKRDKSFQSDFEKYSKTLTEK